MFGYVKTHKKELRIREYDTYCACYCGLCRTMKKTTGILSCATLNYDFVFLALVRGVLLKEQPEIKLRRCIVHPIKKRPMAEPSLSLEYAARACTALMFHKASDDIRDSKRAKKLLLRMSLPFFTHLKKRADIPELDSVIKEKLDTLAHIESNGTPSLDAPAAVFGELLGEIFSDGLDGDAKRIAYETGYHTGKFIYAADAADDYKNDLLSGSYNPIVQMYGEDFSQTAKQSVKTALLCELHSLGAAVELIDFSGYADIEGIIKNIVYLGMPAQMDLALLHKQHTERQRKDTR